jgi:hypothetical protein
VDGKPLAVGEESKVWDLLLLKRTSARKATALGRSDDAILKKVKRVLGFLAFK